MDRQCEKCGKEFSKPFLLKRHLQRKTPCDPIIKNTDPTGITCHHCGRSFTKKPALSRHIHHSCKIAALKRDEPQEPKSLHESTEKINEMFAKQDERMDKQRAKIDELLDNLNTLTNMVMRLSLGKPAVPKRKTIPLPLREAVWRKVYSTSIEGTCTICRQNTISIMNFECGHNKAAALGGTATLDNLEPICGPCNKSMGIIDMDEFKNLLYGTTEEKESSADEEKELSPDVVSAAE